ncbi:hypothetical protein PVK06_017489 [Gossypium arboreum]|uniref:Gag-pol polyprotein n=1 Tax=Gossypium arboreum TaxID=29729 RepID=A0ABR0Q344_GOSAR|nr:hypothetical protein PVK06_017489 [Gossypium arboreum]
MILQEDSQRVHLSGFPIMETVATFSNAPRSSDHRRYNGVCDYYKIKGHYRYNCYRLIGFPSEFKFTKKKIPQASMAINSKVIDYSTSGLGSSATSTTLPSPIFTTN